MKNRVEQIFQANKFRADDHDPIAHVKNISEVFKYYFSDLQDERTFCIVVYKPFN
jgi:hypothetical protein